MVNRWVWIGLVLLAGCQPSPMETAKPPNGNEKTTTSEKFAQALLDRDFVTAYDLTTKDEKTVGSPQTLVARTDVMYARTKLPDGRAWRPTRIDPAELATLPTLDELNRRFAMEISPEKVGKMEYVIVPFRGDDDPSGFVPPILHLLLEDDRVAYFAFETPRYARYSTVRIDLCLVGLALPKPEYQPRSGRCVRICWTDWSRPDRSLRTVWTSRSQRES
ncbi:MAG: hypothetical protein KF812_07000 [Fimbriimonadaceae bacterium]|nr:hypothetical protein [Fimbriimonadaceae bacterium]